MHALARWRGSQVASTTPAGILPWAGVASNQQTRARLPRFNASNAPGLTPSGKRLNGPSYLLDLPSNWEHGLECVGQPDPGQQIRIRAACAESKGVGGKLRALVDFDPCGSDLSMELVANQPVSPGWMVSGSDQFRRTVAGGL